MKKLKVYLDTSVISHLQADDVPEKMEITNNLWKQIQTVVIKHVFQKWFYRSFQTVMKKNGKTCLGR